MTLVYAAWDPVHTDYAADTALPGPRGLAESTDDWLAIHHGAPNGHLLHPDTNQMLASLTSGGPVHLMHTTPYLDAIRASGELHGSGGCLVGALYCAPLTPTPDGLRPHNLGTYLLRTKPDTKTLVFEVRPEAPAPPKGLNYLHLGGIHLDTYLTHRGFLTAGEDDHLRQSAVGRLREASGFLDLLLADARGERTASTTAFFHQLAATVPHMPFLGYLYFEVLSEYLLLHSTSPETKAYAFAGEMNNRLYKEVAFSAVKTMGRLFDLALFNPDRTQLTELIDRIDPALALGADAYVRRRLPHLFACAALGPDRDAGAVSFRHAGTDFDTLATMAPHLAGQLVFREMRTLPRYPALFPVFEQAKATSVYAYWNNQNIAVPFNGVLPKGELGLNLAFPRASCTAWVAETCERGLLHPTEQLNLLPVPRLADLRGTALGRAAFPGPPAPPADPSTRPALVGATSAA
ncbi:hypothetical protein [Streptomyces marianii]|uniref:hypothetical protein n=1 Tax=Streptomyces marianii TaxID=1817406 RepID=UPI001F3A34EA|nr:hypothetical protein [Streptomyces marianii]